MGVLYLAQASLILACAISGASACSRLTYTGAEDGRAIVGRSMDWLTPTNSTIWAFPAGLERNGTAGGNSIHWTSKYGSVITSAYDIASCDGMNERGLVVNLLYLANGDYGPKNSSIPGMSIAAWPQYFLDQYETVKDAAADLFDATGQPKYQVRTRDLIPGVASFMHLAITDASGDNLILEWLDGELIMHHGSQYNVMTNEPDYDQQLAISQYWSSIANVSLPGTDRPADRFARLSHYVQVAPAASDWVSALSTTAGMIRAVSVPMEPININTPNITPTLWRTFADTKDLIYYYESATDGMYFYVDLTKMHLSNTTANPMKLSMVGVDWADRVGDMTAHFEKAEPFAFLETTS